MLFRRGQTVRFRLSPDGETALKGLFDNSSFQVKVEEVDDLGVWILLDKKSPEDVRTIMLLKWDYFSTVVLEVEPEMPSTEKLGIGFKL